MNLEDVLRNNRFAVLATMDYPPRKQKHVVDTRVHYNVQLGKEHIMTDVLPAGGDVCCMYTTSTSTTTFYGQCYNCHYRAHSQKHCPLSRCSRCGDFGHSDLICATHPFVKVDHTRVHTDDSRVEPCET